MVRLFGFGSYFGVLDASPFVVKADLLLKMSGLAYQYDGNINHIKNSPKNKLPYIQDGGRLVGDSHFIQQYLKSEYQVLMDEHLSEKQLAQASLYSKAIEEGLYWCLVYSRWIAPDTWPIVKDAFFGKLPLPLRLLVPKLVQKGVKKNLYGQGILRHSEREILQIANEQFATLSVLLADQDYFFGQQPSTFDAIAYSMLMEFISVNFSNPFNEAARSYPNLLAFCQRIENQYY
ncbi:glutathione S-transferase family protein [Thalassotalea ganghwensis]